ARGHLSDRRLRMLVAIKPGAAAHRGSVLRTQPDPAAGAALGKLPQDDLGAGKAARACPAWAAALPDRPFESRFDRRGALVEIGAVEAQARLEAQAVPGAEADRRDFRISENFSGNCFRRRGGNADLETVLSRIARPRDRAISAEDRQRAHIHEAHGRDS